MLDDQEHLGLYNLMFRDLFKSSTKITDICKDLKELLDVYYHAHQETKVRIFSVIVILSNEYKVVPL